MTTTQPRPINDKDRAAHERMGHYTTEALATTAARMIALSHHDIEPMLPFPCKVCGEWCLTVEGTGVAKDERPSRASKRERARQAQQEYAVAAERAAAAWSS